MVLSTLTIGILTPQLIGCATTSQTEPFQKLEKENVIEAIQTVTEEEKESLVETTSEEIESENRMVEEDTSTSVGDKVEQIEENTENLKETTGVQIVEELNQKMWTTTDCNGYDVDGTNGESTFFNAGYSLTATGLTSNHWYRVETGSYIGYIPVDYLSTDESYSLESITAKAEAEAERKAAEEAARLAAQTEAERKAEEERLARERAEQQAKESEEQRLLREEQERNAEAARKAEEERLAAEQATQQQESQQEQQTTQTVENSTNASFSDWGGMNMFSRGGDSTTPTFEDYGHTGEVGDMTDMSDTGPGSGMKYDPNAVWE